MRKLSDWDQLSMMWHEDKSVAIIMFVLYTIMKSFPWVLLLGFITLAAYIIKSI